MICGHDRETLQWALSYARDELRLETFVQYPPWGDCLRAEYLASRDIIDPAKLAAIIAELMHGLGLRAHINGPERDDIVITFWPNECHPSELAGIRIRSGLNSSYMRKFGAEYTMSQVRVFALRLLDATTATAQDIDRMIGEL
jgi:hypothetical protein